VEFIEQYGDRIVFVHLRNQYQDGKWSESLAEGDMDLGAIGRALRKANFSGDVVVELAHENNFEPTRPWRMSRAHVKKTMGW
jgi:sugar phosphate isomerase/epimerase